MNHVRARVSCLLLLLAAMPSAATDLAWLDDPTAVQNFVSGIVAEQLAEQQAVGIAVSIVRGGKVVLAQGYGDADRAQGRPVVVQDTLFRIGSISKMFVWVAVMQQVAAGKLDLDADVNSYLTDLRIPDTYPDPITLKRLMTHTAGFEDGILGLYARGPRTVGDFHSNLISMLPHRVMMPGRYVADSNYGAALAAHLVEIASGETWDDYVLRHILQPLGMLHTTTQQTMSEAMSTQLATGYWWDHGRYEPAPFEFVTLPPAGSISATVSDMGLFTIELLARGDTNVLPASARAQLFAPGFAHEPRLNGMLHGMYEQNSHGQKLMGHAGHTMAFRSELLLCPALDLGVFVAYNSDRAHSRLAASRTKFISVFLDRLFGAQSVASASDAIIAAERYVGYYSSLRVPVSGHDKIASLLGTLRVSTNAEHELLVSGHRFVPIDANLFAEVDGVERVAFRVDGAQASHLFFDSLPMSDFRRVQPRDNPLLHAAFVASVLILCAAAWLFWPLSWLRNRGRITVRGEKTATFFGAVNAALIIFYCGVVGAGIYDYREIVFGLPEMFQQAMWIPIALIPLLFLQLGFLYQVWVGGLWWVARRIHYTLLTFGGIAFVVWAFYWHLTAVIVDL